MRHSRRQIPPLVTTSELLRSDVAGQDAYGILADATVSGGELKLRFPPDRLLCALKEKTRDHVQAERGIRIPTFNEVMSKSLHWPPEWLVVGAGPYLWLSQEGSRKPVSLPLLKRNGPVFATGKYTPPSGVVSDDPIETLWREANEELCLLIKDRDRLRRAFFVPPGYSTRSGTEFLESMRPSLRSQEPEIRDRIRDDLKPLAIVLHPVATRLADINNPGFRMVSVAFADRPAYRLCTQIFSDPVRPNVNINPVATAILPPGELIHVDPEGFKRDVGLFSREALTDATLPKTVFLDAYAERLRKSISRPDSVRSKGNDIARS